MRNLARTRVRRLAIGVWRRAAQDDVPTYAGALTYQAFLSLLPLALLGLSAIGFLLAGDPSAREEWVRRLTGSIPGLSILIGRNMDAAVQGRFAAGAVGLAVLAWRGSTLAGAAAHALGRIFRTEHEGAVRMRMRAVTTMALLGVLALGSTALTSLATGLHGNAALRLLGITIAAGVDLGFFAVAYRTLTPRAGPSLRRHLPGAALMTCAWTALKLAGSGYAVLVVSKATALYGTVGAVFGLFAILSLASRAFLYGAELTAVLLEERQESVMS